MIESPNQLELSDEQRQQLMTYMENLEEQRTSDPTAFQKTMESLGLQSPMSSSGFGSPGMMKYIRKISYTLSLYASVFFNLYIGHFKKEDWLN